MKVDGMTGPSHVRLRKPRSNLPLVLCLRRRDGFKLRQRRLNQPIQERFPNRTSTLKIHINTLLGSCFVISALAAVSRKSTAALRLKLVDSIAESHLGVSWRIEENFPKAAWPKLPSGTETTQ